LALFLGENDGDLSDQVVVYDVSEDVYRLLKCRSVWKTNSSSALSDTFSSQVLKTEKEILSCSKAEDIYNRLSAEQKQQSFRTGTF
jgi:hypothetical protein